MQYSTFLNELQNDSDDENATRRDQNIELPLDDSHFKKFEIRFRNNDSKDEVKNIMSSLEKEALLLDLIPIVFNEELQGEIQTFSVFAEKRTQSTLSGISSSLHLDSLATQKDLLNAIMRSSKDWTSFLLKTPHFQWLTVK